MKNIIKSHETKIVNPMLEEDRASLQATCPYFRKFGFGKNSIYGIYMLRNYFVFSL